MTRFFVTSLTALALLAPVTASAQEWKMVYRPELRGMIATRVKPATPAQTGARTAEKHSCACCADAGDGGHRCDMMAKGEMAGHKH